MSSRIATVIVVGIVVGAHYATPDAREGGEGLAPQAQSVWDGVYTDEQADRGESLYQESCASCHAPDLSGGDMAPGLAGGEFVWNWSGLTVGQLFERLRISMPQENPSGVSRAQKADILAFVLRANGFPVGERELADRAEMLEQFMFEAVKPQD